MNLEERLSEKIRKSNISIEESVEEIANKVIENLLRNKKKDNSL